MDALVWVVVIAIGVGGVWIGARRARKASEDDQKKP